MFGQQNRLKELFEKYGWEFIDSQSPSLWWIVEIWLIRSLWSPTDCKVFLSFIVHEEWTDRSRAASGVNRIDATINKPIDWLAESEYEFSNIETETNNIAGIYLGHKWERNVSNFFEELAVFRSKYKTLKK